MYLILIVRKVPTHSLVLFIDTGMVCVFDSYCKASVYNTFGFVY